MSLQFVLFGDRATNALNDRFRTHWATALRLLNNDQLFGAVGLNSECRAAARSSLRVALLHSPLDVLRIVIASANDNQVFEATRDEQIIAMQETQVAGSEKRSLACIH
jgi:hypothetical protein